MSSEELFSGLVILAVVAGLIWFVRKDNKGSSSGGTGGGSAPSEPVQPVAKKAVAKKAPVKKGTKKLTVAK